jgi:hypothetical protein
VLGLAGFVYPSSGLLPWQEPGRQISRAEGSYPRQWVNKFVGTEKVTVKICLAAMFWSIWKTRNKTYFENILPNDPCEIIYQICHWIDFWSELQKSGVQRMLRRSSEMLKMVIRSL